jgi:SNF2 family DNA or RNA helicase
MNLISLMPHQKVALERLKLGLGQILSLPCGAGKTLVALKHLSTLTGQHLIVCPKSLLGSWQAEADKWDFPVITKLQGTKRKDVWDEIRLGTNGIYAIGYESLLADYRNINFVKKIKWNVVVGDESSKIKTPTAKVSKMFRMLLAEQKILLNATVIENSLGDLWAQAEAVEQGVLYGNFWKFRAQHAVMNEYYPGVQYWRDKELIIEKCRHIIFSVPKEEVQASLPPLTEQVVPVEMSPEQARVYKKIRDELLLEMQGEETVVTNALAKLTRLRQTTNGLWAFGDEDAPSGKVDALEELLDQFGEEKSIIFTQFAETAEALRRKLKIKHVITGETKNRDEVIADWRKTGTALVGTSALYKGMNLQDARFIVFVDTPWTYALYEQAVGRAWRTGQKNPVTAYTLEAVKTVDEKIRKLVLSKKEDGDMLTRMTIQDIKNLLVL